MEPATIVIVLAPLFGLSVFQALRIADLDSRQRKTERKLNSVQDDCRDRLTGLESALADVQNDCRRLKLEVDGVHEHCSYVRNRLNNFQTTLREKLCALESEFAQLERQVGQPTTPKGKA